MPYIKPLRNNLQSNKLYIMYKGVIINIPFCMQTVGIYLDVATLILNTSFFKFQSASVGIHTVVYSIIIFKTVKEKGIFNFSHRTVVTKICIKR